VSVVKAAAKGMFYAVGVGPGAEDLVTLRAARLVETADVVIAPRASVSSDSLALSAVRPLLDRQELIEVVYPMERNQEATRKCWSDAAQLVAERCRVGKSVVQITIGDPLIFSTSAYLIDALKDLMPHDQIRVVPGISAFQASASQFIEPLTLQEDRLMLMPATRIDAVETALDECETLVLYKVGPRLKPLLQLLECKGLLEHASLVCHAEQGPGEMVLSPLTKDAPEAAGYMSVVIIRIGRRAWA